MASIEGVQADKGCLSTVRWRNPAVPGRQHRRRRYVAHRRTRRNALAQRTGRWQWARLCEGRSFVRPPTERLRRTSRPGTRTLGDDLRRDAGACDFAALSRIV